MSIFDIVALVVIYGPAFFGLLVVLPDMYGRGGDA
jgi:hypothetical protein